MTQNITAQQCKTELENILKDAVENGNFKYNIEVSTKNFYKEDLDCIEIAIKGKENETKEIFVGTDYTALDNEDVRRAFVRVRDLLYWNKSCWRLDDNENKEGEYYLCNDNYIITQLIFAQHLWIANMGTAKDKREYLRIHPSKEWKNYADDYEFYIFVVYSNFNRYFVECSTIGALIYMVWNCCPEKEYGRDWTELEFCTYFKLTGREVKKAFKNK